MLRDSYPGPGYHAGARVDRVIVGTGRCGSTLLSRMLAECPDLLSGFEYFNGMDMTLRFAPETRSHSSPTVGDVCDACAPRRAPAGRERRLRVARRRFHFGPRRRLGPSARRAADAQ
jgi:hypothetical protein